MNFNAQSYKFDYEKLWLLDKIGDKNGMYKHIVFITENYSFEIHKSLFPVVIELFITNKDLDRLTRYFMKNFNVLKDKNEVLKYIQDISWTLWNNQDYDNLEKFLKFFLEKNYFDEEILDMFLFLCNTKDNIETSNWFMKFLENQGKKDSEVYIKLKANYFTKAKIYNKESLELYESFYKKYGYNDYIYEYIATLEKLNKTKQLLEVFYSLYKDKKLYGNDLFYYRYLISLYADKLSFNNKYLKNTNSRNQYSNSLEYKKNIKEKISIKVFGDKKKSDIEISDTSYNFEKKYNNSGLSLYYDKSNIGIKYNDINGEISGIGEYYFKDYFIFKYKNNDFFDDSADGIIENLYKNECYFDINLPIYKNKFYLISNYIYEDFFNYNKKHLVFRNSAEIGAKFSKSNYDFSLRYKNVASKNNNSVNYTGSFANYIESGNVLLGNINFNFNISNSLKTYLSYEKGVNLEHSFYSDYFYIDLEYWVSNKILIKPFFDFTKGSSLSNYDNKDYSINIDLNYYF